MMTVEIINFAPHAKKTPQVNRVEPFSHLAEKNERDARKNSEAFLIILFKILCKKKSARKNFCFVSLS